MNYMQFRIHPGVGLARMGDSPDAYYLASDFPHFLQEAYPELRLRPRPRVMPESDAGQASPAPGTFRVFDDERAAASRKATNDSFRDKAGRILPQAARFRIFAYCFASRDAEVPMSVFEVTTDHADIEWRVRLANHKAQTGSTVHVVGNAAPASVKSDAARLLRLPVMPDPIPGQAQRPPLAHLFLERKTADKTQVNGRLHLIGNPGETTYFGAAGAEFAEGMGELWFDNWFDSEADGPVEAVIRPKGGGAALMAAARVSEVEFLDFGIEPPVPAAVAAVKAAPAWAIVGLPDYCPDIAHFVSLWDLGLANGLLMVDGATIKDDPTHHKLIRAKANTERFRRMDYRIHIHPQLCTFRDVNWVSGATSEDPGHNTTTQSGPAPSGPPEAKLRAALQRGGLRTDPRDPAEQARLADPAQLKDPDPGKPLGDWLKIAFFERLRQPGNLYNAKRKFFEDDVQEERVFPRHLGRRWRYNAHASAPITAEIRFPSSVNTDLPGTKPASGTLDKIPGNLRPYHNSIERPGRMCGAGGQPKLKPGMSHPAGYDDTKLLHLDDMYWPINAANMPLLRELAYTHLQYEHFRIWKSSTPDAREQKIFDLIVPKSLDAAFRTARDVDEHFAALLDRRPKFVPALIDMASLGTALGGSFLPGIEVGLEGGRLQNWTLYHGGTEYFPDVRFEKSTTAAADQQHFPGILTKDLAIPWSRDYRACLEEYWPTARPGWAKTSAAGPPNGWMVDPASGESVVDFFTNYWKRLGFIRRNAAGEQLET